MSNSNIQKYADNYFSKYPDNIVLKKVAEFFLDFPDSNSDLQIIVGDLLRGALDEVIDMPRTARFSLDDLEKTEKTYIGTKVEILFRDTFLLKKGQKLDLCVEGYEVDVKNTIGSTWTIPSEALNEICVLLQTNDKKSLFYFGLVICRDRVLNQGKNRDDKRTISKKGKEEVFWLVEGGSLPRNFFLHMEEHLRHEILSPKGGANRLANLFRGFQEEIITRRLVECVARQKDYMKRIRGNGGARDILDKEGLLVLWGGSLSDRTKLNSLGFQGIGAEHFVCVRKQD